MKSNSSETNKVSYIKRAVMFFSETLSEVKKLHFPEKREVYLTTVTMLATIVVFSLAILFADFIISKIIKIIFGL